jgi:hypothetical protein
MAAKVADEVWPSAFHCDAVDARGALKAMDADRTAHARHNLRPSGCIHRIARIAERLKILRVIDVPVKAARDVILQRLLDMRANISRFGRAVLSARNAIRHGA